MLQLCNRHLPCRCAIVQEQASEAALASHGTQHMHTLYIEPGHVYVQCELSCAVSCMHTTHATSWLTRTKQKQKANAASSTAKTAARPGCIMHHGSTESKESQTSRKQDLAHTHAQSQTAHHNQSNGGSSKTGMGLSAHKVGQGRGEGEAC